MSSTKKTAIIAGAGPAGLTAALEFATRTDIQPIVFEQSNAIGGISRTVHYNGNRIDIGGHRFFTKNNRVNAFWNALMPMQTSPAKDEIMLGAKIPDNKGEYDPEASDKMMLRRQRVSRIYFLKKFFDYPVTLSLRTLCNLGLTRTVTAGFGFLATKVKKRPDDSLENFYINRFGAPLYHIFFEDYTEKVWGIHPSRLGADWGSQRVKGLSVTAILRDMFLKKTGLKKGSKVETSLIEEFTYPKLGPGQLWELTAGKAVEMGANLEMETKVERVNIDPDSRCVVSVTVKKPSGESAEVKCDWFVSSMPIKDLIASINGIDIPADVLEVASTLPYRDFITVGLLLDKLLIKNQTKIPTIDHRVPDTWIYVQERDVKLGRIQIFNNWSPYMVKDFENQMWIGLEYFCKEGDEMWKMSDQEFIEFAIKELESIRVIAPGAVKDAVRIKVKKAYPAYFGSYYQLGKVREFLDTIPNLFCIGRNGQHRYNNMDHSMLTAMNVVDTISNGSNDKNSVWNVNTEKEYHESK